MSNNTTQNEITVWAAANFAVHAPHIGIAEEIGELCHAILKRKQRIRGFDDPVKFHEAVKDAIADAGIYLMHWLGKMQVSFVAPSKYQDYRAAGKLEEHSLAALLRLSAQIMDIGSDAVKMQSVEVTNLGTEMAQALTDMAAMYSLNLMRDCIEPTWEKVKLRNWKASPTTGV